jgi:hypothetical protein
MDLAGVGPQGLRGCGFNFDAELDAALLWVKS